MRSHNLPQLFAKEWRELLASRAYWLLLLIIGPLVGHSFITAVDLYAEASGIGGGPAALSQGLSPLDGILVPTFGAYDLAVTLLFPFVAIRLIAAERESGALKLMLQFPASLGTTLAAKGLALVAAGMLAWIPGLFTLLLWKAYGGHLYAPEMLNLLLGHLLRVMLSGGIAIAAAAIAESAASAAIVTLGFTVGTWALDFIAAGRGGWLQEVAAYTPTAVLRVFEQGLLQLNTVIVIVTASLAGGCLAAVWLRTGRPWPTRALATVLVVLLTITVGVAASHLRPNWDFSEDQRNSFSPLDEAALRQIKEPLHVTVYLGPEDGRLRDLQHGVLNKLKRLLCRVDIDYAASTRLGLFETAEDHYGEVWYAIGDRNVMSRSTTVPIVLEELYLLAGITPPVRPEEPTADDYPGYPLAARPKGASWIFYVTWPVATVLAWWLIRRPRR